MFFCLLLLLVISGCTSAQSPVVSGLNTIQPVAPETAPLTIQTSLPETTVFSQTTAPAPETSLTTAEPLPPPTQPVSFESDSLELNVGESCSLQVVVSDETLGESDLSWLSSNEGVAIINQNGRLTGRKRGQCTVSVSARTDSSVTATLEVNVVGEDWQISVLDGVYYIQNILLVNKTYPLPATFDFGVNQEAKKAFDTMQKAAEAEGIALKIVSGYRSYEKQSSVYANYSKAYGSEAADTFSARPGHSEHQSGLAFDLNSVSDSFADTTEAKWLEANCASYGFIIRYPKGKEAQTGYKYEPWHVRFVGCEMAQKIFQSGLCLEEYFSLSSQYGM